MLIPSFTLLINSITSSLSRRVNANSQPMVMRLRLLAKLIKKGEC